MKIALKEMGSSPQSLCISTEGASVSAPSGAAESAPTSEANASEEASASKGKAFFPDSPLSKLERPAESEEEKRSSRAVEASHTKSASPARKQRERKFADDKCIRVCLTQTKYRVLRSVCRSFKNWVEVDSEDADWDLLWTDTSITPERLISLKPHQKINHFVGTHAIARKNYLARNLQKMKRFFPSEYRFFPSTWMLPTGQRLSLFPASLPAPLPSVAEDSRVALECTDAALLKAETSGANGAASRKTLIVKPCGGSRGRGIFLTRNVKNICMQEQLVVQRYIHRPLLLDGFKFDLRLYLLMTHCDPLKLFLHREGLVRLATHKYVAPNAKNRGDLRMHLTNYSINKASPDFQRNRQADDAQEGHKRSLFHVFQRLKAEGYDVESLQRKIDSLLIKTLLPIQPAIAHTYNTCRAQDYERQSSSVCFELFGVDVMVDHKLEPWLLEVNHSPSFATDSPVDKTVKSAVIGDALRLLGITIKNRKLRNLTALRCLRRQRSLQRTMADRRKTAKAASLATAALDAAVLRRSAWEDSHLGGYRRLYPVEEDSEAEARYAEMLCAAKELWRVSTGVIKESPLLERLRTQSLLASSQLACKSRKHRRQSASSPSPLKCINNATSASSPWVLSTSTASPSSTRTTNGGIGKVQTSPSSSGLASQTPNRRKASSLRPDFRRSQQQQGDALTSTQKRPCPAEVSRRSTSQEGFCFEARRDGFADSHEASSLSSSSSSSSSRWKRELFASSKATAKASASPQPTSASCISTTCSSSTSSNSHLIGGASSSSSSSSSSGAFMGALGERKMTRRSLDSGRAGLAVRSEAVSLRSHRLGRESSLPSRRRLSPRGLKSSSSSVSVQDVLLACGLPSERGGAVGVAGVCGSFLAQLPPSSSRSLEGTVNANFRNRRVLLPVPPKGEKNNKNRRDPLSTDGISSSIKANSLLLRLPRRPGALPLRVPAPLKRRSVSLTNTGMTSKGLARPGLPPGAALIGSSFGRLHPSPSVLAVQGNVKGLATQSQSPSFSLRGFSAAQNKNCSSL